MFKYPKNILTVFILILAHNLTAQTIFFESFDEGDGSTAGTDDVGTVAWTATCPDCIDAGDYYNIQGGQLEGQDTNGPATFESSAIDISSCTFFEINLKIKEEGTLEGCGTGCVSVDWVQLEYNIDNTGWQDPANAFFCAGPCADLNVIQADDVTDSLMYSTGCINGGTSLQIRVNIQSWASSERWLIDDIEVACTTGPSVNAGLDQSTCDGQDVTLTATNPDMAVITWDNSVVDGVAFTPPLGTTTYTVTATAGACSITDEVDVVVTSGPTFTVTGTDATSCTAPFDGVITLSGLTGGEDYDLAYFDGGIVGPATFTANGSGEIVLSGLAPGSYTNFAIDSSGCVTLDNTNINITTPGSPTIGAGLDQTICEGQSVTLTANNPDVAVISWDNGVVDGVAFTPGVGVVNYTVTGDLLGCTASDVVTVTVNAIPTVSVTPAGPFAPTAGTQNLAASPAGGTWSSDCGACVDANTGIFDPAVAGVGTWNICYDAGVPPCDDQECIQIVVTGNCLLTGVITSSNPSCFGFSDGSATINTSNATGNQTFVITDSQGNVVNVANSNTANNLSGGWYYLNVTDEFPCNYLDSVFLVDPLQIDIDLDITDPLCYGVPTGLAVADTVYNYQGAYGQISYFWAPNPGQNGIGEDSLVNVGGGDYTLIINDENGCTETFDFTITYPDSLFFQELGSDPAFCRQLQFQSGNGVVFAAASGGTPDYDYTWTNLQTSATTNNTTWGGLNPGDYQITVTDNNNCLLQQTITLDSLNPQASYDIASPQFLTAGICEGTAVVDVTVSNQSSNYANPNNPNADTTFFWNFNYDPLNPGLGWLISHDETEVFDTSYTTGGTYEICLVALNKNGCSDTTCKEIVVFDPLSFTPPNVFTPNGDGSNDEFTFEFYAKAVVEFSCVIVDRWGRVVAEFNSITDSWNGQNAAGNMCPDGVYFYTYEGVAENGDELKGQGNVHLLGQ